MDEQEAAPLAVHGGEGGTLAGSGGASMILPPEKSPHDLHHEGATSSSTNNEVPATTAPSSSTPFASSPPDSDPENVGMPIEGDDVAFDASGFSGGEFCILSQHNACDACNVVSLVCLA